MSFSETTQLKHACNAPAHSKVLGTCDPELRTYCAKEHFFKVLQETHSVERLRYSGHAELSPF